LDLLKTVFWLSFLITAGGLDFISKTFSLCKPAKKYELSDFMEWMDMVYSYLAMVDYPFAANFLEPLPAWPVKGLFYFDYLRQRLYVYSQLCILVPFFNLITAGSLDFLTKTFSLCKPVENKYDLSDVLDWLASVYVDLAMVDYPYAASFLEPLPGWPVKVCFSTFAFAV
jgi:hypothetical protein